MNKEMRALAEEPNPAQFEQMLKKITRAILAEVLSGDTGIRVAPLNQGQPLHTHGFMITFCRGHVADDPG